MYFRGENSEPCKRTKMNHFAQIIKGEKQLTNFQKRSILDVWQGSDMPLNLLVYSSNTILLRFEFIGLDYEILT